MSTYLVTGSTGVVGSAFVERLLRETTANVVLVIRTKKDQAPNERLEALLRFWALGPDEAAARARVTVLPGDTEAPRLGLSAAHWERAASSLTHLVHAAAIVKMTLPIEEARRAAVSSVQNVLALARDSRSLQKVELVSTVGIGGRRSEPLPEEWVETPRTFHNTYEEAKADAEKVAHQAVLEGLPVTIHRPSMVVGDSRTGKAIAPQIFSYLCDFLTGVRVHGVFPPLTRARLDVVPVDWVTGLLLTSSQEPSWAGRILHACSGDDSVPLTELRERVQRIARQQGRRALHRVTLPLGVFRTVSTLSRKVAGAKGRQAAKLLDILLAYLEDDQRFENRKTLELAASKGLRFLKPPEYLDAVLQYRSG